MDFHFFRKLVPLPLPSGMKLEKHQFINIAIFIISLAATFTFSILEIVDECIFVFKLAFLQDLFFSSFIPEGVRAQFFRKR